MKLTPWFPNNITPERNGIYQRDTVSGKYSYSYWNGVYWSIGSKNIRDAVRLAGLPSDFQNRPWRGILK